MAKTSKSIKCPHKIEGKRVVLFYGLLVLFPLCGLTLNPVLSIGQLGVVVVVWLYMNYENQEKQREIMEYLQQFTGDIDTPVQDNLDQMPIPAMVYRLESEVILWSNPHFTKALGISGSVVDKKVSEIVKGFNGCWLIEGKTMCTEEQIVGDRRFLIYGGMVRSKQKGYEGYLAATYWVDVTEFALIREEYEQTRPAVAVILLDNYEDFMRNLTDSQSSALLSAINRKLSDWVKDSHGVFKRYSRESYILVVEQQYLDKFIEKKFDILDSIREIISPTGINVTLSIGIGTEGETMEELLKFANLAIDMSLSRGGDQVAIRNQCTFEFYGGRAVETEKRTKVKSRVMANALASLIADSSRVFIMGHRFPDMDVVGAAAGVFALGRKKDTPSYIIRQGRDSSAEDLYDKLEKLPAYNEKIITAQEALVMADSRSLLVVVDTNRPDQVQSIEMLEGCNRVAVIDHHRRASSYIEGAVLNYHELYASSACELVTELLQYTVDPTDLFREEAEALLAGIVLDTKNFTLRTGGRTFEAAAFLRRCGADTNEVKKLFQNDLEGAIGRYKIVQSAQLHPGRDDIAFAWSEEEVGRVVAAQAADELLNIRGIATSFVLFPRIEAEELIISARSMGDINVQLVLEQLGGGGNAAAAGVQLAGKNLEEGMSMLKAALNEYLKEE